MKIGFIGLGIMGSPMAKHLLDAGHNLFVRTRSKVPAELTGATVCASPAEVARAADIVFLMLPDTPDVEKVLFAEDGVAHGTHVYAATGNPGTNGGPADADAVHFPDERPGDSIEAAVSPRAGA